MYLFASISHSFSALERKCYCISVTSLWPLLSVQSLSSWRILWDFKIGHFFGNPVLYVELIELLSAQRNLYRLSCLLSVFIPAWQITYLALWDHIVSRSTCFKYARLPVVLRLSVTLPKCSVGMSKKVVSFTWDNILQHNIFSSVETCLKFVLVLLIEKGLYSFYTVI